MEALYTDEFINICYHKNTNTLSGVWSRCENTAQYDDTLDSFKDFFERLKPKSTLWNKQKLAPHLFGNFHKKTHIFFNKTRLSKDFETKIAIVLNEDLYKQSNMLNLSANPYHGMNLSYFDQEKTAIEWLYNSFSSKETNLKSQLNIEEAGGDAYEISLTVKKNDVHDYLAILDHLLKNREFCLKNACSFNSLTCREREILQHLLKGLRNADIADHLFLSVETVKTHRKRILAKLDCQNIYKLSRYSAFFRD